MNEEQETSKEELEPTSEELTTINQEMADRNVELNRLNADLDNMSVSIHTAILVLGRDLTIRRFTPLAERAFNLLATDVGRSLSGIRHNLLAPTSVAPSRTGDSLARPLDLETLIRGVIDTVSVHEREVQDSQGHWYSMRVRPYLTLDNKIDGAVLALVDIDALKRTEREAEIARDAAEAIIRATRDPLVVLHGDLRVKMANEAFYGTFKVDPTATEGRLIYDVGNGQWNIPALRTLLADILPRNGFFNDFEVTHEFQGIGPRTMLLNGRCIVSDTGAPGLIVLVIEDITERRRADDARASLAAIVESSDDAIIGKDLDSIVTSWNRGAERIFGYTADEAIGQPITILIPDDRPDEEKAILTRIRSGERIEHYETVRRRKDGSMLDISLSVSPILGAHGKIVGASKIARDITERKQAEEAMRLFGERFRLLAQTVPQKIFTARPSGDVDYYNPQWTDYTGLSFEQIRDWGWTQFIHPDDVAENIRVWKRAIATGEAFHFEHRFRRADGEYRWHVSRAVALKDAEGRIVMWVGANNDVHDVKAADQRKDEFLALLAHELRNPLAPLGNALHVLRQDGELREAGKQAIDMMQRQVAQMVRLVDDLLDVSRISQGKIELQRDRIELASAVNHAVEAARPLCTKMEQEMSVTMPPRPVYLYADPTRLAQIIGNLLNNACKYSDRGGRIGLIVETNQAQVVLRVRDSGIGIAAEQLPRIFEMFRQVDTSLERAQGGLGIGLTLVKKMVEMHDGTIEAHSGGLAQGSEFVVRLPISTEVPDVARAPAGPSPATTVRRRVLVVDDNMDSANSMAMLLELSGHEVHTANDGIAAVEAAAQLQPDLILLDIGLPGINGFEAARRIRQQQRKQRLVLVALTGWGQDEDRRRSREAGFDFHLVKPADISVLETLLGSLP